MRLISARRHWTVALRLLLCLAAGGCRFIGCGAPAGEDAETAPGVQHAGRISAATAGAHGVIAPGEAPADEGLFDESSPEFSIDADADPQTGGAPLDVSFTLTLENPPPGLTVQWNFGDQTPTVGIKSPSHLYREPGEYTAIVTVTASGIEETREFSIEVTEEGFDVDIEADPDVGPTPLLCKFNAVVDEEIETDVRYDWDFGDGSRAVGKATEHTYKQPGQYTAKLTVTNSSNQVGTKEIEIQVDEPEDESDNDSTD